MKRMFSKESSFQVVDDGRDQPKQEHQTELQQLEQIRAQWYSALEEGYQSKRLPVLQIKQDGMPRLFFILKQENEVNPLKTTVRARTLRDDLAVYDLTLTYVQVADAGVRQETIFKLIPDPGSVGVDALETLKLVKRIIQDSSPSR